MSKNKKEKLMQKAQVGEEIKTAKPAVISLAFRVKPMGDGLYGAEILMLADDIVVAKRNSPGTTLGHAIAAADDLMDGWAFNEVEQKAQEYFEQVFL
jgi:hypothetical protein